MARTPQDVPDAELAILHLLWDWESATIRRLTDELYPGGNFSHYTTVQKLLDRLGAKGYVARKRRSGPHLFTPRIGRDDLLRHRLQAVADKLCDGSLTPLLTHLVQAGRLSAKERKALRALIDQTDRKPKRRTKDS